MVMRKRPVEVAKRNMEVACGGKVYTFRKGKPAGDIPERIRLLVKHDLETVKDVEDAEQTD